MAIFVKFVLFYFMSNWKIYFFTVVLVEIQAILQEKNLQKLLNKSYLVCKSSSALLLDPLHQEDVDRKVDLMCTFPELPHESQTNGLIVVLYSAHCILKSVFWKIPTIFY